MGVGVEWVVVHGDHAEEVIVVLGDGLPRPVLIHVADLEVLEVPPESPSLSHASLPIAATTDRR